MSTLTTEDWTTMRELVADVVDLRLAATEKRFLTKDDAKNFLTKDDAKNFLTKDDAKNFLTKDDAKNFLTKDDARNFLTKDDAKNFLTKDDANNFATKEDLKSINESLKILDLRLDHMEERWEKVEIKLENLFENDQDNRQRIHRLEHGLKRAAN